MTFDDIADGTAVYLDANVVICDFTASSQDCSRLLQRCRKENLYGLVSTVTVIEVCHRTMCEEAKQQTLRTSVTARYLKEHPNLVRELREYAIVVQELIEGRNLGMIEVTDRDLIRSQGLRERYGLLTNDSIIAQLILDYDIPAIATNDPDFERVEGVQVFKPGDI